MAHRGVTHDRCGHRWTEHTIAQLPGGLRWVCPAIAARNEQGDDE